MSSPGTPDPALVQQALQLFGQQRMGEALPLLEQLLETGNTPLPCVLALADARERTGNAAGAINLLEHLYRAIPQEEYAVVLAAALLRAGARSALDHWMPQWIAAHPGSTRLLAMQSEYLLKSGAYARGFALMPYRWALSQEQRTTTALPCPDWDGRPFDGTLLVGTEQGLGDVVLWSSLFEDLVALRQRALIACDPRLLPLFRRSFPGLAFADRQATPLNEPGKLAGNRKIESVDMAPLFRSTIADFPTRRGWLQPDAVRTGEFRKELHARFPGKRLVGLSWRSHRDLRGETKNIPVTALAPLLKCNDLVCFNLQYGDTSQDMAELAAAGLPLPVDAGIDVTRDIDGVAALLPALDCVVSSSNTLAHLAGALGVDTCVLVPGARYVLWYWGYDGDTTAWYPAARIFRGPPREEWQQLAAIIAGRITDRQ